MDFVGVEDSFPFLRGYETLGSVLSDVSKRDYEGTNPVRINYVRVGYGHVFVGVGVSSQRPSLSAPTLPSRMSTVPLTQAPTKDHAQHTHTLVAFDNVKRLHGLDYRDEHSLKQFFASGHLPSVLPHGMLFAAHTSPIVDVLVGVHERSSESRHYALDLREDGSMHAWLFDVSSGQWRHSANSSLANILSSPTSSIVLSAIHVNRSSRLVWCERRGGTSVDAGDTPESDILNCSVHAREVRVAADGRLSLYPATTIMSNCTPATMFELGAQAAIVFEQPMSTHSGAVKVGTSCDSAPSRIYGDAIVVWDSLRDAVSAYAALGVGLSPVLVESLPRGEDDVRDYSSVLIAACSSALTHSPSERVLAVTLRGDGCALILLTNAGSVHEFGGGPVDDDGSCSMLMVSALAQIDMHSSRLASLEPIGAFCGEHYFALLFPPRNFAVGPSAGIFSSYASTAAAVVELHELPTGRHVHTVVVPFDMPPDAPLSLWGDTVNQRCGLWNARMVRHLRVDTSAFTPEVSAASGHSWVSRITGGADTLESLRFRDKIVASLLTKLVRLGRQGNSEEVRFERRRLSARLLDAAVESTVGEERAVSPYGLTPEVRGLLESGVLWCPAFAIMLCAGRIGCAEFLGAAVRKHLAESAKYGRGGMSREENDLLIRYVDTVNTDDAMFARDYLHDQFSLDQRVPDQKELLEYERTRLLGRLRALLQMESRSYRHRRMSEAHVAEIPHAPYWWAGLVTKLCHEWPEESLDTLLSHFGLGLAPTDSDFDGDAAREGGEGVAVGKQKHTRPRASSALGSSIVAGYDDAAVPVAEYAIEWLGPTWRGRSLKGCLRGGVDWRAEFMDEDAVRDNPRFPSFEYACHLIHKLRPTCLPRFVAMVVAAMTTDDDDNDTIHAARQSGHTTHNKTHHGFSGSYYGDDRGGEDSHTSVTVAHRMYERALDLLPKLRPLVDWADDSDGALLTERHRAIAQAVLLASPALGRIQDAARLLVQRGCLDEAIALTRSRKRKDDAVHYEMYHVIVTSAIASEEIARSASVGASILDLLPEGQYSPYALLDSISAGLELRDNAQSSARGSVHRTSGIGEDRHLQHDTHNGHVQGGDVASLVEWEQHLGMEFDPSVHRSPFCDTDGLSIGMFGSAIARATANLVKVEMDSDP
eukprot:Opistho-2@20935